MTSDQHHSRVECCLLSGLLGDAWGGAYEGQRGPLDPHFPRIPVISDDTQLSIATCEAIVQRRGLVDAAEIASRFRAWFESGRLTGLGSSTLKAVRDLSAGAHWALAGARGEFAAGAGAAMRAAPLAFFLDPSSEADRLVIRDVCRITHHSDEAYAGCLAVICAVRTCQKLGSVPESLLLTVAEQLPDTAVRDRTLELRQMGLAQAAALGSSGYVVDAVPLALRVATAHPTSVTEAIRSAISVGGDTDTIAAMAAQIVGASGVEPPHDLLSRIPDTPDACDVFAKTAALLR